MKLENLFERRQANNEEIILVKNALGKTPYTFTDITVDEHGFIYATDTKAKDRPTFKLSNAGEMLSVTRRDGKELQLNRK